MSNYEFLEETAELVTGQELGEFMASETGDHESWNDAATLDAAALVIGHPWACAGVLVGTRESLAATLRGWLALVEEAPVTGGTLDSPTV